MKLFALMTAIITTFGCGVAENESQMKQEAVAEAQSPKADQKILHCVETQTFGGAGGYEYRIALSQDGVNGYVVRREVQLGTMEEQSWKVAAESVDVEKRGGNLYIAQKVSDGPNWDETDSCFQFELQLYFNLTFENGQIKGHATNGGVMHLDRSVPDCRFPHRMPPYPQPVKCTLY